MEGQVGRGKFECGLWGGQDCTQIQKMLTHLEAFETLWPKGCRQGCKGYRPKRGLPTFRDLRRESQPKRLRSKEGKLRRYVLCE